MFDTFEQAENSEMNSVKYVSIHSSLSFLISIYCSTKAKIDDDYDLFFR
jgi:hypothetical protein